ncbi:hypothetical protein ACFXKS_14740 [Streptomyces scopuliridis]|uniref:hypothetical protein n=1 Tax=Streptomyces scopuliridis TaxID=452529 RepID=UPI0036CDEEEE
MRHPHVRRTHVTLPEGEFTIRSDARAREAATRMFFQAAPRIGRRLEADGGGTPRNTLNSLYALFAMYRDQSKADPPPSADGVPVHWLAMAILTRGLRPFLSVWHPRLAAYERAHPGHAPAEWEEYAAFAEALGELRRSVHPYIDGLGRVAGLPDPGLHLRRFGVC